MQNGLQQTSTTLSTLPTGLQFPGDLNGRIRYDSARQTLTFLGVMQDDQRDRLLKLAPDQSYQQAILQLYGNSRVVIETRNLTKVYRDFWGRQKVRALQALDLKVYRGEVFGLLGPNGSGKTTTIKLLLGLLFPTEGEALVLGQQATNVAKNERIGYLPEESYLYRFLNAEETLDFYGRLFEMPSNERRERSSRLIQRVGLHGARHRPLKEYSKGMTRRIGLAQALINDPELILLDEPTTGFDPIGTREMKDLILELKEEGKTVVMCSHQLSDVQDVCDRIAILHQGELKELGRVDDLISVQDVVQIRARNLSDEARRDIEELLQRHGAELLSVENPTTTLEELFLRIVRESEERPGRRLVGEPTADAIG
jgi:ABC-2 type transport system ATP-binding protein